MSRHIIVGACVALAATSAHADLVAQESEPNNSLATANFLGNIEPLGGSLLVDGNMEPGDVDWFSFNIGADAILLISQVGSSTLPLPDLQLQLLDSGGTPLEFDDDDGPGLLPAINVVGLPAGDYFIGISGFADLTSTTGLTELFDGLEADGSPHDVSGNYKLSIDANLVPAPGAFALTAVAGFAATRRRR